MVKTKSKIALIVMRRFAITICMTIMFVSFGCFGQLGPQDEHQQKSRPNTSKRYIRVICKEKLTQLKLPEEVNVSETTVQRSKTTGFLKIKMPKANSQLSKAGEEGTSGWGTSSSSSSKNKSTEPELQPLQPEGNEEENAPGAKGASTAAGTGLSSDENSKRIPSKNIPTPELSCKFACQKSFSCEAP